ncbi:thiamine pyrophosphate-dependent enzyme [Gordonia sp. LSe1-13]|uniref:dihydrolipoyllysine-residue succinyltransferase n=1 Tax=Gordonia sesuvii TaxID=3116777 RepID=A0ABU7MA45_9ACTN|nr:thiamine pyrophosphate-dependent enzyme [Gordonia sp. LSe1-13]
MTITEIASQSTRTFDLVDAYRQMLTIRTLEELVLELRREEAFLGSTHVCVGQEVPPVAFLSALREEDRVLATYRGHGWALACGVPPQQLLGEIMQRSTGVNGGRGGSAYLTAPKYRFVGENSIVGAGLPIANGVAMAATYQQTDGVTVVSFGDGATNQGASHEALVFAVARKLPVIFVCENNYWSEMTPITDTVPNTSLVERARGYGMHSVQIDGGDVAAIASLAREVVERARRGEGPTFVEVLVPRLLGHYNADIQHYRSDEDHAAHRSRDAMPRTRARILQEGILTEAGIEALEQEVRDVVAQARADAFAAPAPEPSTAVDHVVAATPVQAAKPLPTQGKSLAYGLAANRALSTELRERPNALSFGEDIAIPGGTFGVTRGLRKEFGERVFDTPIAEASILGAAVGSSMQGMRPIVEIMWMDFLYVAFDQLLNQAANVRYISRGEVTAPMVVRMQQGASPGSCAQHAQSLEAILAHVPGIKVGMPTTPHDAYAMLRAAVADDDPVVIIEARELYLETGIVDVDAPVESVGGARLRREGSDVLIVSWGRMVNDALAAAEQLEEEGIAAAVLDLRWLTPLDLDSIGEAVRKSHGKVVVAHEANLTGGFGAEIAARIAGEFFTELDAPIRRVGSPDVRMASAPSLRNAVIPQVSDIVDAARETARF